MKKSIIISCICLTIIIILVILSSLNKTDEIKKSLLLYGFEASSDELVYNKNLSDSSYDDYIEFKDPFDNLTFNMDTYELNRNIMFDMEGIDVTYNFTCNYINEEVSFIARYTYDESNTILNGMLSDDDFTCNGEVSYLMNNNDVKKELCLDINKKILDTNDICFNIFNEKALSKIKEKTEN